MKTSKVIYDALAISQKSGNSESFIEFMLNTILQVLEELPSRYRA